MYLGLWIVRPASSLPQCCSADAASSRSLAEDFEFSQDAWRRGFTCGRIHGIVREQSPTTLRDFLKQRRRWFMGIRDIKGLYGLPHLAINLWIVGVFTLAVTVINIPFLLIDKSLTPLWIAICADFCFVCFFWLYIWGILFQVRRLFCLASLRSRC